MLESKILKPKRLKTGDRVAVIAPSSCALLESVEEAKKRIEALGFEVILYPSTKAHHGHLAGEAAVRVQDIHDAFSDSSIDGIICLKGGSGSSRLLDKIDYSIIRSNPKVFVGYSDVTGLHSAFFRQTGLVTFHGPMGISSTLTNDEYSSRGLLEAICGSAPLDIANPADQPIVSLVPGEAEGIVVGGNLSLLISTLGSPYEIDTAGKLLLIEDVDEPLYVVDRMLSALRLAGKFKDAAGIVLGTFTNCKAEERPQGNDLPLETIFREVLYDFGKPIINNVYFGHNRPIVTLPLGIRAKMISSEKGCKLTYLESATIE